MADVATPAAKDTPAAAVDNKETPNPAPAAPVENKVDDKPAAAANPADKPADKPAQEKVDDKANDKPAPAAEAEPYDLVMPEKSTLKKDDADKIASFAKEHGLSQDVAQALLDRDSSRAQESLDAFAQQSETWKQEILNDKEMGGENAAENIELASRFAKQYWDDDFIAELERTGLGNHPGLMKGFYRASKAFAPDKMKGGGHKVGSEPKSLEEKLYGGTKT